MIEDKDTAEAADVAERIGEQTHDGAEDDPRECAQPTLDVDPRHVSLAVAVDPVPPPPFLPGAWNALPSGGNVLLDAEGKPERLAMPGDSDGDLLNVAHAEAELRLGVWFDIGEPSVTDEGEAVATCKPCNAQPTHRVTFTPTKGEPQAWLVMLDDGAAYTHAEWDAEDAAAWEVIDGRWQFCGQATPGGEPGEVKVEKLEGAS